MIGVCTGSRLHFGMLSLSSPAATAAALPTRYWGGVGVMVREPSTEIIGQAASTWQAEGPQADRIRHFARLLQRQFTDLPPIHFTALRCAPDHQGLGSGTQLGLAAARIAAEMHQLPDTTAPALAALVERGARSAIGIHGFDHGGLIVEAGKTMAAAIAPAVVQRAFPDTWRLVLLLPRGRQGLHGRQEQQVLEQLQKTTAEARRDRLCRLVLLGLLPALIEQDVQAFGEALYEFNRTVGEAFAPVQGGIYAHPGSEKIVHFIRQQHIPGAGQSSWGPTLFAVAADADQAQYLVSRLHQHFPLQPDEILITSALNQGAVVDSRQ